MEQSSKALPETSKDQSRLPFQILGICLIALALLMVLSLLSHSPEDPPIRRAPTSWRKIWLGGSAHTYPTICYLAWAMALTR